MFLLRRKRRANPEIDDMKTGIVMLLSAALPLGAVGASPAAAQSGAQVGTLSCDVSAGIGMILTQKQTMTCMFTPANGGPPQPYLGHIDTFGVALGAVNQGQLVWGVIASSSGLPLGALSGDLQRGRRPGDRRRRRGRQCARRRNRQRLLPAAGLAPGPDRAQRRRGRDHAHPAAAAPAADPVTKRARFAGGAMRAGPRAASAWLRRPAQHKTATAAGTA